MHRKSIKKMHNRNIKILMPFFLLLCVFLAPITFGRYANTLARSIGINIVSPSYTVTFDALNGSVSPGSKSVTYGHTYGTLPEPERTGYVFRGWNGRNLIDYTKNYSGNLTVSNTGYVTSSTPEYDYRNWTYDYCDYKTTLPAGTYTLSLNFSTLAVSQAAADYSRLIILDDEDNSYSNLMDGILYNRDNFSFSFTLNSETNVGILVKSYDGVYRIQLESGSTSHDWEPYNITSSTTVVQSSNHTLTAIWEEDLEATFAYGQDFNKILKSMANNETVDSVDYVDTNITSFIRYNNIPSKTILNNAQVISSQDSETPIYAWYDNGTIYYYTEALNLKLDANAGYMFSDFRSLNNVDLGNVDSSDVLSMYRMFYNCISLVNLDLSSFVTTNITNTAAMFAGDSNLLNLDLSNFSFSSVTDNDFLFQNVNGNAHVYIKTCNESRWIRDNLVDGDDYPASWDDDNILVKNSNDTCDVFSKRAYMVNLHSSSISEIEAVVKSVTYRSMTSDAIEAKLATAEANNLWNDDLSDTNKDGIKVYGWAEVDANDTSLYNVYIASEAEKIYLPVDSSWTFNGLRTSLVNIDFGTVADASGVMNMYAMFNNCANLTNIVGLGNLRASRLRWMDWLFQNCSKIVNLDLSGFNTSNVDTMWGLFDGCTLLQTVNLSSFDTSNVTVMSSMFHGCRSLTSLDLSNFDTGNVVNMSGMFGIFTINSLNISNFDTSSVTDMNNMFSGSVIGQLTGLTNFDTELVQDMSYMFFVADIGSLNLSSFDTSSVTSIERMFDSATATTITLGNDFDLGSATDLNGMFAYTHVTSLNLSHFDTSSVTSMQNMFVGSTVSQIIGLDNFDTSSLTNMTGMFSYCANLANLNLTAFTFSNSVTYTNVFSFLPSNAHIVVATCNDADYILDTLTSNDKPAGWSYNNINTSSNSCSVTVNNIQSLHFTSNDMLSLQDKTQTSETRLTINDGTKTMYATIKLQGTSSLSYDKKNYNIVFYSDNTYTTRLPIDVGKGWGGQSKYCLKANWIDSTQSRNIVSARLAAQMQAKYDLFEDTPNNGLIDGFFVEIYVNDEYLGLYTMNIPKGDWMFGMDKSNPNHIVMAAENPLQNSATTFETLSSTVDGQDWSIEVGPNSTAEETAATFAKLNRVIAFVKDSSNADFRAHLSEYIDLDALMNYYIFMALSNAYDNMNKNMLLVTYDGLVWYPSLYDLDSTWGLHYDGNGINSPLYKVTDYMGGSSLLFAKLLECFPQELQQRYNELRSTVLTNQNIINKFNQFMSTATAEQWAREHAKWTNIPGSSYDINQISQHVHERGNYIDSKMIQLYFPQRNYGDSRIIYQLDNTFTGDIYKFLDTGVNLYKANESDQHATIVIQYKSSPDSSEIGTIFGNRSSHYENPSGLILRNSFDGDDQYSTSWAGDYQYEALYPTNSNNIVTMIITMNGNVYNFYSGSISNSRTVTSSVTKTVDNNLVLGANYYDNGTDQHITSNFKGSIYNFTIYDEVLSNSEITAIFNDYNS